jgi:predicted HicB family RNase H-like nuclease
MKKNFENIDKGDIMLKEIQKESRETKSRAFTLLLKPSIYQSLKAEAQSKGMSFNEIANRLFEQYINRKRG